MPDGAIRYRGQIINPDGTTQPINSMDGRMNDDDEYDEDEEEFQGTGIVNDMDFFTWDLIIKNTPKLPQIDLLLHKN